MLSAVLCKTEGSWCTVKQTESMLRSHTCALQPS